MKILIISIITLFSFDVFAHGGGLDTKRVCNNLKPKTCIHAHFHKYPTSVEESFFDLHIESSDRNKVFTNVEVELWMDMGEGHGHGSAPVVITPSEEENHFDISSVWFPMMGEWQIKVNIIDNNSKNLLIIPVNIKE